MPKARSPNREKAFRIYKEKGGKISNKELAELLNENEKTISNWKSRDKWNVVNSINDCSNTTKKRGAQKGNKNAKGNKGGGAPLCNQNGYKHGIYSKILYSSLSDDEKELFETRDLNEVEELKLIISLCDIQILRFINLINEIKNKKNFIVKSINKMYTKNGKGNLVGSVINTTAVSLDELIIRYNSEIEKIKKQKIKCLELLNKINTDNVTEDTNINVIINSDKNAGD